MMKNILLPMIIALTVSIVVVTVSTPDGASFSDEGEVDLPSRRDAAQRVGKAGQSSRTNASDLT